jgi:formylglycine-generating enzyme required for sulfatase activity
VRSLGMMILVVVSCGCYGSSRERGDAEADGTVVDEVSEDCAGECALWAECGDDGCGGSCGTCGDGYACGVGRVCVPAACVESVRVPAGSFWMGSDAVVPPAPERWVPRHRVVLSTYRMGACEVTNAEYAACMAVGQCTEPYETRSLTRPAYFDSEEFRNFPVIAVDWGQADVYCRWVGGRLPSEAMWEKAARGGCELRGVADCTAEDAVDWPWGDEEPRCDLANAAMVDERDGGSGVVACVGDPAGPGDTDRVGARPSGASVYGVLDLVGNVWEWTSDWYNEGDDYWDLGADPDGVRVDPEGPPSGTTKITRGGSFGGADRIWFRGGWPPVMYPAPGGGFRCAWSGE